MKNIDNNENPYLSQRKDEEDRSVVQASMRPEEATEENLPPAATEQPGRRRRRVLIVSVALLGAMCAALGVYALYGGRKTVDYKISEQKRGRSGQVRTATGTEPETPNQITADAIRLAKEELGKSGEAPTPTPEIAAAATPDPARKAAGPAFAPFTISDPAAQEAATKRTGETTGESGNRSAANSRQTLHTSSQAAAHSLYVAEKEPEREVRYDGPGEERIGRAGAPGARNAAFNPLPKLVKPVTVPGFGSMLPVRTLGAIFTLRSSLVRLETTRDVEGEGWSLKRGTVLVARQEGSEYDRAYLSLMGFIDPATNRLVKLGGELMGGDGAPGLKGKRRQISSRWARVFSRAANGAIQLGSAALSRGNTTVIVPGSFGGVGSDLGFSSGTIARREFVEVPASTQAYVMVSDLPSTAQGVDAEPASPRSADYLADEELAELLSSGRAEDIRAALPRMTPEMRKVAMLALGEK